MIEQHEDQTQQNAKEGEISDNVNGNSLESNVATSAEQEPQAVAKSNGRQNEVSTETIQAVSKECATQEEHSYANDSFRKLMSRIDDGFQPSEAEQIKSDIGTSDLPEERKNALYQILRRKTSDLEVRAVVSKISLAEYPYINSEEYKQITDSTILYEDGKTIICSLLWELDSQYLTDKIKNASFPDEEETVLGYIKNSTLPENSTVFRPDPGHLERVFKDADCAEEVQAILNRLKENASIEIPGKETLRKRVMKIVHPEEYKKQAIRETIKYIIWGLIIIKIVCWIGKFLLRCAAKMLISTYAWLVGADELYELLDRFGMGNMMADELIGQIGILNWHWFYILSVVMIIVFVIDLAHELKD